VLLVVNALALRVLLALDAGLLARTHAVVGGGVGFGSTDPRLTGFEMSGLAVSQLAGFDPSRDALLLLGIALDVGLQAPRRRRIRIARDGVVLLVVDLPADLILLAVDLGLLGAGQRAVLEIARPWCSIRCSWRSS
jgi:hypothetical protein